MAVGILVLVVWKPWQQTQAIQEKIDVAETNPSTVLDPRLTLPTLYRNVRPDVKYVGDKACAGCHAAHDQHFHTHPMSRSFVTLSNTTKIERFDASAFNPFDWGEFRYHVENRGTAVWHVETVKDRTGTKRAETAAEVQSAVGSGRNGRAYLYERDGYLFASPLTWYPQSQRWDLSPGYSKHNIHFGRPITSDCLFCHANSANPVSNTTNQYRDIAAHTSAIGCERCHGPGELHVASRQAGPIAGTFDDTIVNPAKLEHSLREDVCHQCHLQGQQRVVRRGREPFDFRPGLPLKEFMTEFVAATPVNGAKFVGSVEQMEASVCYQKGSPDKKMGCISCHDPHSVPTPETKVDYYRGRCLTCHQDKGCSVPVEKRLDAKKQDNCVACHMPPTGSNVNHTTINDHRILRRPDAATDRTAIPPITQIVPYAIAKIISSEMDRDLGIALMRQAERLSTTDAKPLAERAVGLLERAVKNDATDVVAGESLGSAYWYLGRLDAALTAYERVLAQSPDRETTLHFAASVAVRLNRPGMARSFAERTVRVNPHRWEYQLLLARACGQLNDWKTALTAGEAALRLNASDVNIRQTVIVGYARLGLKTQANQAFDELVAIVPAQAEQLKKWFAQVVR